MRKYMYKGSYSSKQAIHSRHKRQEYRHFMNFLLQVWTNCNLSSRTASGLRRHDTHFDTTMTVSSHCDQPRFSGLNVPRGHKDADSISGSCPEDLVVWDGWQIELEKGNNIERGVFVLTFFIDIIRHLMKTISLRSTPTNTYIYKYICCETTT